MSTRLALLLTLALSLAACGQQVKRANEIERPDAEQNAAPVARVSKAPAPAATADQLAGTVVETMDAGGYTYVRIDSGSEQGWAAAPAFPVSVGDKAVAARSMPMRDFASQTLDRTFDLVYFCSEILINGAAPVAQVHGGAPAAGGVPAPTPAAAAAVAEGDLTVASIHAQRAALAGQQVVFVGEVVKWNPSIMGRNWLHVQDGSGEPGVSDDLTVTTSDEVAVGDQVVVRGTLNIDRDFGAGYSYALIVEEARVTIE